MFQPDLRRFAQSVLYKWMLRKVSFETYCAHLYSVSRQFADYSQDIALLNRKALKIQHWFFRTLATREPNMLIKPTPDSVYKKIVRQHLSSHSRASSKKTPRKMKLEEKPTTPFATRADCDFEKSKSEIQKRSAMKVYQKILSQAHVRKEENTWVRFTFEIPKELSSERRTKRSTSATKRKKVYDVIKPGRSLARKTPIHKQEMSPKSHVDLMDLIKKSYSECKKVHRLSKSPPKRLTERKSWLGETTTQNDKKQRRSRADRLVTKMNQTQQFDLTSSFRNTPKFSLSEPKPLPCHFTITERIGLGQMRLLRQIEEKVLLRAKLH